MLTSLRDFASAKLGERGSYIYTVPILVFIITTREKGICQIHAEAIPGLFSEHLPKNVAMSQVTVTKVSEETPCNCSSSDAI